MNATIGAIVFFWVYGLPLSPTGDHGETGGFVEDGRKRRGRSMSMHSETPVIHKVRPLSGRVGERVKIEGSGFGPEAPVVTFAGVPARIREIKRDEINVFVPVGAISGPVVVSVRDKVSQPVQFTVLDAGQQSLTDAPLDILLAVGSISTITLASTSRPLVVTVPPDPAIATAGISSSVLTMRGIGEGTTTLSFTTVSAREVTVAIRVQEKRDKVSFSRDIQPIFDEHCTGCHGGSAGMYLDAERSHANLVGVPAQEGCTTDHRVVPGNSPASVLFKRLSGPACGTQMPKKSPPLPADVVRMIADWIDQGAENN